MYPIKQEQTTCSPMLRHILFGPQGDGSQGFFFSGIAEIIDNSTVGQDQFINFFFI